MNPLWSWLRDEQNTKAIGAVFVTLSAASSASIYVYSSLFPPPNDLVIVDATEFVYTEGVSANIFKDPSTGSQGCPYKLVYNQPPFEPVPENSATYRVSLRRGGRYTILIEYAASEPRPIDVTVNGDLAFSGALKDVTKSWCLTRWSTVGTVTLDRGPNDIRLSRKGMFPHLRTIHLVRER